MQNSDMGKAFEKILEDMFSYIEEDEGIVIGTLGKNNSNDVVSYIAIDCRAYEKIQEKIKILQFLCGDATPENSIKSLFNVPPVLTGRTKGISFKIDRKDNTTFVNYQSKGMINGKPELLSESTVIMDEDAYKDFKSNVVNKGAFALLLSYKGNVLPFVFLTIDDIIFSEKI